MLSYSTSYRIVSLSDPPVLYGFAFCCLGGLWFLYVVVGVALSRILCVAIERVRGVLSTRIIYNNSYLSERMGSTYKDSVVDSILTFIGRRTILLAKLIGPRIVEATRVVSVGYIIFIHNGHPSQSVARLTRGLSVVLLTAGLPVFSSYNLLCRGKLNKNRTG